VLVEMPDAFFLSLYQRLTTICVVLWTFASRTERKCSWSISGFSS
jgi:hypothetical protein